MLTKQYSICIVFKCDQEKEIFIRHIFCKITFLNCYISHKKKHYYSTYFPKKSFSEGTVSVF